MMKGLFFVLIAATLCSCGPVVFGWRSYVNYQHADTEGVATGSLDENTMNADKTNELQSAVSTNAGSAKTSEQSHTEDKGNE